MRKGKRFANRPRDRRAHHSGTRAHRKLGDTIQRVELALDAIRVDGAVQARAQLDTTLVTEYAEAVRSGESFPPLVVFHDGRRAWLADGFHRHAAYVEAGIERAGVELQRGTRRDAILFAVGANARHGLRRTNADKRCAIEKLLRDPEWSQWTNREIARQCVVGHQLVARVRAELGASGFSSRYAQRVDTVYMLNTAPIGRANTERARNRRIERGQNPTGAHAGEPHCSRCGRVLSDPKSVALGIGPECRANGNGRVGSGEHGFHAAGTDTRRDVLRVLEELICNMQQALASAPSAPAAGGFILSEQTMSHVRMACQTALQCIAQLARERVA